MRLIFIGLLCALMAPVLFAKDGVLMFGGDIEVEITDLDALLSEGPLKAREDVLNNKKQILQLLRQIYLIRALADEYEKQGLSDDKLMQARLRRQRDKLLYLERLKEIDNQPTPDFEQAAKEQYLGNPDAYTIPEKANAKHILIATTDRLPVYHEREEALEIANKVKAELDSGSRFEDLVPIYSEDTLSKKNQGSLGVIKKESMSKPVVKAVFDLNKPGEISDVVESEFGFHIIKLVARYPAQKQTYKQVRLNIIDSMRKEYIQKRREAYFDELLEANDASIYEDLVEDYMAKGLKALEAK